MKKRILALCLSLVFCVPLLPAALAEGELRNFVPAAWAEADTFQTYDQAVAELQAEDGYATEQTFESDYGTVFLYNHGPNPHAQHGFLTFVTKAPCAKGAGKIIGLPQTRNSLFCLVKPPHAMALSEDGKTFTYSYHYDDPVLSIEYKILRPAGDYSYVLDLTTGNVTENYTSLGYEKTLARLMEGSEYEKVAQVVEGPAATAVLWYQDFHADEYNRGGYQSYYLYLVFKDDNAPEAFCRLLLPSTEYLTVGGWAPTNRAPDSMAFSEDGKTLTYTYIFDAPLSHGDTVYHEAGTYTYTADAATGELTVSYSDGTEAPPQPADPAVNGFADVAPTDWFAPYVRMVGEKGVMIGTGETTFSPQAELTRAECLTLAFRLYDLLRGQEHTMEKAPEDWGKLTLTLADGTVFAGYGNQSEETDGTFRWWANRTNFGAPYVMVPGWTSYESIATGAKGQRAWMDAHPEICDANVPATLTLNGVTYRGTTDCWMPVQPWVFQFHPEEDQDEVLSLLHHAVYREVGPDRWWRDTAYTIARRELEDVFDPVEFSGLPASRSFFARLIAAACEGYLDKLNTVEAIPDLPRESDGTRPMVDEYRGAVYTLYEAGILTGVDGEGTFSADGTLTRAEAAAMVARAVDESLRVKSEPLKKPTYESALAELRSGFTYLQESEQAFDTDDCTVLVYDRGGAMNCGAGYITIIYKPGSVKGDGFTITPPTPGGESSRLIPRTPDNVELSKDRKTFTYSYHFNEPMVGEGRVIRAAGDFVYTVDLPTGEVTENIPEIPPEVNTYAASLERFLADCAETGYRVEQTIEAPLCSLVFLSSAIEENGDRGYLLYAVYKSDVESIVDGNVWYTAEGMVKCFGLPTTRVDLVSRPGAPMIYTHHMPDSMALSEDGNTFTLIYNDPYEGNYHTQVIDLLSGLTDRE